MTNEEIRSRYNYHAPTMDQQQLCDSISHVARDLALCINDLCPKGRNQSLAFTGLEEVLFRAHTAIVRGE